RVEHDAALAAQELRELLAARAALDAFLDALVAHAGRGRAAHDDLGGAEERVRGDGLALVPAERVGGQSAATGAAAVTGAAAAAAAAGLVATAVAAFGRAALATCAAVATAATARQCEDQCDANDFPGIHAVSRWGLEICKGGWASLSFLVRWRAAENGLVE